MVTLEVSSTDIKLMEVNGRRVTGWASQSLEPGMFEDEALLDHQAFGAAVKSLMVSSDIKSRHVIASVNGLYSLSRIIAVPTPLEQEVTEESVLDIAGEVLPLSEENLYIFWRTVGAYEGTHHVLVIGIPKDVIDNQVQALRMARINPRILDIKGIALARAVNREQAIILNIENTTFDIILVVNGAIEVMRTSAWQQEDLSLEEKTDSLSSAVDMTIDFHNSHNPNAPVDMATPLFITGQLSGNFPLVERLQEIVGYPVEPLEPPLDYPPHFPISQYAVNIGLALKKMQPLKNVGQDSFSAPDINLLPQVYRSWRPTNKQIFYSSAIIAGILLVIPLYNLVAGEMSETSVLERRYDSIQAELQLKQLEIKRREPLEKAVSEYNTIVDMGGGIIENITVIYDEAEKFGITVKNISHTEDNINIVCDADSYIDFREYISALEESGHFLTPITEPERFPYLEGGTVKITPKPPE
ncbi:pilus assembly protein PilM [Chloroflexota bacterium]